MAKALQKGKINSMLHVVFTKNQFIYSITDTSVLIQLLQWLCNDPP